MSEEDILKAGIAAARAGERTKAASFFAQAVKANPSSEPGWLYLGMCCTAPDQREYCFRKVLALNPNNSEARNQLAGLSRPAPAAPAAPAPERKIPLQSSMPPAPSVSPFVHEARPLVPPVDDPPKVRPAQPPVAEQQKPASQPKKSNRALIYSLLILPVMAGCALVMMYLLFPGRAMAILSPIFPGLQTPIPQVAQIIPSPVSPATATPAPPTSIPSPLPTVSYMPVFEETACPFERPPRSNVTCGYLIVPEDRTGDPAQTIRLAVAVYHSASDTPEPDPVIFLQGGPGGEAVQLAAYAYNFLVTPFLSERDFIVFDQRGTGLSEPVLECEEVTKLYSQDIHGLIPSSTRELVYSNAFLSCNGMMRVSGVDLNAYTTAASAADVRDLLTALNYQKVNLYGASYGTRLALVVMREYPEIVETAILDSVVPVESNLFNQYPDSIESALKALFDACAADAECHAAYPELETMFWELATELDVNPVTVTTSYYPVGTITETVAGSTLLSTVLGSVRSPAFIGTVPQSIDRIRIGDYSTLIAAQYSLPFAFEGISPGLYISMMCHEHILATSVDELKAVSTRRGIKDQAWLPFYGDAEDLFRACQSWGSTGPFPGENEAVRSEIPALVIAGSFDPATPPFFARQVAGQLTNSYYFEFPNQGHTPTATDESGCAMDTVLAFLEDPSVEPDRECLDDLAPVDFIVPYTGEPPQKMETNDVWGVTVKAPSDWYNLGDGFFFRGNSPLDITQIGVFQDYLTPEELVDWFSLGAYGYRGLDSPPFQVGQRKANGLTWSLYLSTSNGRPVDIAMADRGRNSLVIMMFSNLDEHEALYNTVFLPMVDSAR
jgi:pimeloyl-ACP methyl ester carboxylesterase